MIELFRFVSLGAKSDTVGFDCGDNDLNDLIILKQDRFAKLAVCITLSFGEGRVRIIRKPKPVWYRKDARNYQQELLSVTYLFEKKNGDLAAFFSVSNDALHDNDFERWNNLNRKVANRKRRKEYPAVKIGAFRC